MADRQLLLQFEQQPSLAAADFVVADGNRQAYTWVTRWPDWPGPAIALYGDSGCGKTHLMNVFAARSGALLLTGDCIDIEQSIAAHPTPVAVDDADRGIPDNERALLHLFNILKESGRHLLLAARTAPAHWPRHLADLRSRLMAAPAIGMGAPDDTLLRAIVVKLFADRQIRVSDDVVAYLLARCERAPAAMRDLVTRLDEAAARRQCPVTVPLVRAVLAAAEP